MLKNEKKIHTVPKSNRLVRSKRLLQRTVDQYRIYLSKLLEEMSASSYSLILMQLG